MYKSYDTIQIWISSCWSFFQWWMVVLWQDFGLGQTLFKRDWGPNNYLFIWLFRLKQKQFCKIFQFFYKTTGKASMWSVEKQCILSVYSVYTQPMSCILGGFCFFPQCIIHNRLMGGWIWESVSMWVSNHFFIIIEIYYRMCIVCASVECIIWNNFRQKRLRLASEFSQPLSTRVLDTPIIFSYLLIFIFIKKTYRMFYTSPSQRFIQCTK